ncbi:MAG TPA: ParB/RepB/Spo0J family partition protein [Actinomycetota bacterium]|nr:ParB/RepB/Spo0J family partition protein [Actinomycetota bacterium]
MAPGGLGKGLGALIPTGARVLEEVSTESIHPNPRQPRRTFEDESLATLAASIRQLGLLQPVVVRRRADDSFELVMGERRWRAAGRAGLATIPAIIMETDDQGALERALVENLHRQDLNAIEEAAAYKQLLEDAGLTHEQLAERVGLSRPSVTNALRLLDLPDGIQSMVIRGRLSAGHARALLSLGEHPMLERLAQRVAAEGLSVRQTEELARATKQDSGQAAKESSGRAQRTPAQLEIAERLCEELNTRVSVTKGKGKGKIVIEFGDDADLDRIFRQISKGSPPVENLEGE